MRRPTGLLRLQLGADEIKNFCSKVVAISGGSGGTEAMLISPAAELAERGWLSSDGPLVPIWKFALVGAL